MKCQNTSRHTEIWASLRFVSFDCLVMSTKQGLIPPMVLPHRCVWRVNPADAALCTNSGSKGERERLGAAQDTVKGDDIGIKCSVVSLRLVYTLHTRSGAASFLFSHSVPIVQNEAADPAMLEPHPARISFLQKIINNLYIHCRRKWETWTDGWDNLFCICPY